MTIIFFDFYNIGSTAYMVAFLSDGSAIQVNTDTQGQTVIAPAGTFLNPSRNNLGISQWGAQYLIIVSKQPNGYFLWDGTVLYQAGTIGPQIVITNGGTNYTSGATISFSGGSGSGVTGTVAVTNGIVTGATITAAGSGYLVGETVTATITPVGSGNSATATVHIAPFGVSGTGVETYVSRVWVTNGPVTTFTAPASVDDFSTSNGGGNFTSNDSFLRVGFVQPRQTNGFLYLIADSSINYISGVQTSGNPPTTTFTNQNADPEIGSPYPATVTVFSRNILFANAFGCHVSYGGAVTKISEALDGVFNSVPNFGGFNLSSAKAIIFGKKVWMVLVPVIDFVTGIQVNKLFLWNGKLWFSSQQEVNLIYVAHQEINSVLTAYGTDGQSIFALFQNPSVGFTKTVQSKLWSAPGYFLRKTESRLFGLADFYDFGSGLISVGIDNERGTSPITYPLSLNMLTWTNNSDQPISWTNNNGDNLVWVIPGIVSFPPTAIAQNGTLAGLTVTTSAADMALISLTIFQEIWNWRG